jgi:hypothetical protein
MATKIGMEAFSTIDDTLAALDKYKYFHALVIAQIR